MKWQPNLPDSSFVVNRFENRHGVISGKNLAEIYKAVAEAYTRIISVAPDDFPGETQLPSYKALVRGIRIDPLDTDERSRR